LSPLTVGRYALALLWGMTALVSLGAGREIGYEVLAGAGITGSLAQLCVYGGAALDLALALWLLQGAAPQACLRVQALVVLIYTLLLSLIAPAFWLHPSHPVAQRKLA
jgi:hypothetical protein